MEEAEKDLQQDLFWSLATVIDKPTRRLEYETAFYKFAADSPLLISTHAPHARIRRKYDPKGSGERMGKDQIKQTRKQRKHT